MSTGPRSMRAPARLIAAVVLPLLVGVALSAWFVADQRQRAQLHTDASVRAILAGVVGQVRTAIRDQLSQAATPRPTDTVVAANSTPSDVQTLARDGGAPVLDDSVAPPRIVVPVYRTGTAPDSTEQRRSDITGYRSVRLALGPVLAPLAPVEGGLVVRGPTRVAARENGPVPHDARSYAVDMQMADSPGWVVEAWLPSPAIPGTTWFWVIGLLALCAAIGAALVAVLRRADVAIARQKQLESDRALITGIAPVLQTSLDMGEVLPAVSSQLSDGLALAGLSLTAPSITGERPIFSWGTEPDRTVLPVVTAPPQLAPGATFAVSLTRGGRALGILRVVAGRALNRDDLLALSTASELLGSTLANAESYAQQQELVERMRSVDELKTVFLATASHELRTPVTAIVGFSSLLLDQWNALQPEQGRGMIERVVANGRRLEALIEQLLDFSRLERGLPRSSNELLDLGRTVAGLLSDQPEVAAEHELRLHLADGLMVRGSTSAVERIVTNLVGNAAKYSPKGTTITVTVWAEADRALLVVDDEGPGVADADRKKVFSRFYRGRDDSVSRTKGAGIGLAIVAEYAASMSGVTEVGRSPAGGARFSVSMPAVRLPSTVRASAEGESDVALA